MVGTKDLLKLFSVVILTFCAVCVCAVFLNFRYDLVASAVQITDPRLQELYNAQITMSGVIIACAGGVLGAVTLVVLLFSVQKFIAQNSANLGVLKALGYSENRIALAFSKFGLSVFAGAILGYFAGYLISPLIYASLSSELVDHLRFGFHIETVSWVIIAPGALFTLGSVLYARRKLKKNALDLIRGDRKIRIKRRFHGEKRQNKQKTFLQELKHTVLRNNLLLLFFVGFAGFGFSAQIQMALSMRKITPDYTMTIMLLVIGFILSAVTLLLAFSHLFQANGKYLALLKAYGYTDQECAGAIFGGYRIVSYIGFAIGTGYQFFLVKTLVKIFAGSYEIPEITFNFVGLIITLVVFVALYEVLMFYYRKKTNAISLKLIMQEQ